MMARNEEDMIVNTISCVRNQTVPPTRIHVCNDGSTDATGRILDGMEDVIVIHNPSHPPEHAEVSFLTKRHDLMRKAAKDMDYILSIDGDTEVPVDYMERITERMRLDNVVVTCGIEPTIPRTSPIESGMVIDVNWLNTHHELPAYPLSFLAAESAIDGYPYIVYTNIPLRYKRPMGTDYGPDVWKLRGGYVRMRGISIWQALWEFRYNHNLSFLRGYISYKGAMLQKPHRQHANRLFVARIRQKIGLKQQMLLKTDAGLFILPKDYAKSHSLPPAHA